jgi:hypothetical protein
VCVCVCDRIRAWARIKRLCISVDFIIHVFLIKFHASECTFKNVLHNVLSDADGEGITFFKYVGNNFQDCTVSQSR